MLATTMRVAGLGGQDAGCQAVRVCVQRSFGRSACGRTCAATAVRADAASAERAPALPLASTPDVSGLLPPGITGPAACRWSARTRPAAYLPTTPRRCG
jgi:hypothetical protein